MPNTQYPMPNTQYPMPSVLILAGGKSSRMGQDKALININNKPLLTRTYHIASDLTNLIYIISPWCEKYKLIIPENCHFIQEENTNFSGPLIAFSQALIHIKTEWVLLLACDLPLLNSTEIKEWITYLPDVNKKAIAFLPKNAKGWETLCGFYRSNCLSNLQQFINEGGTSFQHWLKFCYVETIPVKNPDILFNCNTPQELSIINSSSSK